MAVSDPRKQPFGRSRGLHRVSTAQSGAMVSRSGRDLDIEFSKMPSTK